MHTEDLRVRRGARYFRSLLVSAASADIHTAEDLLILADAKTGYRRISLPASDPLLAGGYALLDRDFRTIWINQDRPPHNQSVDAAHEYGHLILHGDTCVELAPYQEHVVGYSRNQRDERDAGLFAAELLLPLDIAKRRFFDGQGAREIAALIQIPRQLVVRQLAAAFATNASDMSEHHSSSVALDQWQKNAAYTEGSTLIYGEPGTGKTTCLIARCVHLTEHKGIPPSRILVIANSVRSAKQIRNDLILSCRPEKGFIPVTTVLQLAYDLLVRFPGPAGLSNKWEEGKGSEGKPKVGDYLELALKVVCKSPEAALLFSERYPDILIDNFDSLDNPAKQFIGKVTGSSHKGFWMTSRAPLPDLLAQSDMPAGDHFNISKVKAFSLAYQYRFSPAVQRLASAFHRPGSRYAVVRRPLDARCGQGSVTIALADNKVEMIDGISSFAASKLQEGYRPDEIVLLHKMASTRDAAWQIAMSEKLYHIGSISASTNSVGDLVALLNLSFGTWTKGALLRAGRMQRYNASIGDLSAVSREDVLNWQPLNGSDAGVELLLHDLYLCSLARNPREALESYVFEYTDYLRQYPERGAGVQWLLHKLRAVNAAADSQNLNRLFAASGIPSNDRSEDDGGQAGGIAFSTAEKMRHRFSPVTISVSSNLDKIEDVIPIVGDHLLCCIYTSDFNRTYKQASRLLSGKDLNTIEDWRGGKTSTQHDTNGSNRRTNSSLLSESEKRLYEQCPRRVYYALFVDHTESSGMLSESTVEPNSFPASPADRALCTTCKYCDICPEDLS